MRRRYIEQMMIRTASIESMKQLEDLYEAV